MSAKHSEDDRARGEDMAVSFRKLTENFVAQISGIDMAAGVRDADVSTIVDLLFSDIDEGLFCVWDSHFTYPESYTLFRHCPW